MKDKISDIFFYTDEFCKEYYKRLYDALYGKLSLYYYPYLFPPGNISKYTAATLLSPLRIHPTTRSPLFDFYLTSICIKMH